MQFFRFTKPFRFCHNFKYYFSYSFLGFSEPAYKLTISVSLHCKDKGIENQEQL